MGAGAVAGQQYQAITDASPDLLTKVFSSLPSKEQGVLRKALKQLDEAEGEQVDLAPGLYMGLVDRATKQQLVAVTSKNRVYMFHWALDICGDHNVRMSEKLLCSDLSMYKQQDSSITLDVHVSEIAQILTAEELQKFDRPIPVSKYLLANLEGYYIGKKADFIFEAGGTHGLAIRVTHLVQHMDYKGGFVEISKDGSVRYSEGCCLTFDTRNGGEPEGGVRAGEGLADHGRSSRPIVHTSVESVKRSKMLRVRLHAGPDAHISVIYPKIDRVQFADGATRDLSADYGSKNIGSALLSSTKISYHGHILETEGSDCIVSFPGKYAEGWRECVEASTHDMGVACVFLCDEQDGFGKHAADPEDPNKCLCHKLYGVDRTDEQHRKAYQLYGYPNEESYKASGKVPIWGCLWFEKWRNNVELAVKRKQRLVAYFFEEQVGEGLVDWHDLCRSDLWDGRGIGGSQKGELAFLKKMGYDFEMQDVADFLRKFAAPITLTD